MAPTTEHRPVLFDEALEALAVKPAGVYMDGTFGRGGHSGALLAALGPAGRLIAVDKDPEAVAWALKRFGDDPRFTVEQGSFAGLLLLAKRHGLAGRVDGILLDLGVSSPQLDQAGRGFSFQQDGPLDMRMDNSSGMSAREWLARAEEREIADVLKRFGEERFARRIARRLVEAREAGSPPKTTRQLAELVAAAVPTREKGKHPATRSFQAIRIFINRELEELAECLDGMEALLAPGGRLVVISFHSLEDRIVKRFIREMERGDRFPPGVPVTEAQRNPKMRAVGKPRYPSEAELAENPRARSAVLRVAERLH